MFVKSHRIKFWLPVALFALVFACSSEETEKKDERFCRCMETADKLNKFSAELLERTPTKEDAEKMKKLRDENERVCEPYYTMSGEEMLKRKAACKK